MFLFLSRPGKWKWRIHCSMTPPFIFTCRRVTTKRENSEDASRHAQKKTTRMNSQLCAFLIWSIQARSRRPFAPASWFVWTFEGSFYFFCVLSNTRWQPLSVSELKQNALKHCQKYFALLNWFTRTQASFLKTSPFGPGHYALVPFSVMADV